MSWEYEWEQEITPEILEEIQDVLSAYGDLELVCIGVANPQNGEGALIGQRGPDGSIYDADVAKDLASDAEERYCSAVMAMRESYGKSGAVH
jgi:hypothetical protein